MVSSTPAGSGLPIGLMPGALPSDHASRHTLNTTAILRPPGQTQFACCMLHSHCTKDGRPTTEDKELRITLPSVLCHLSSFVRRPHHRPSAGDLVSNPASP